MRTSGVLLHPTSLPGPFGAGDLGREARRFVELLAAAGQRWWQVLPVHPPGPGDSPYQALSTFAGSPLLIDLEELRDLGLLSSQDLDERALPSRRLADHGASDALRTELLGRAFEAFERGASEAAGRLAEELEAFREAEASWLEEWTLFAALREAHARASWVSWPESLAHREPEILEAFRRDHARDLRRHAFVQLLFFRQWRALRIFAAERGVALLGDLPMFVAHDSADVWADRELFRLDERGRPTVVSGAPPDDFNARGQVWGHPLFDWSAARESDWRWWRARARKAAELAELVRLDHFIGYHAAWEIPVRWPRSGAGRARASARAGSYTPSPGRELFEELERELGALPFLAEDLGDVSDEVLALRAELGLPGMHVLQFGFALPEEENLHHPSRHAVDAVAYTGTHDNDTLVGWWRGLDPAGEERARVEAAIDGAEPGPGLLRLLFASPSATAIVPAQDLLLLGTRARMNSPGSARGNWRFRLRPRELGPALAEPLERLTRESNRWPSPSPPTSESDPHPAVS